MARLAVSDKNAGDEKFKRFLPIIKRESADDRKMVMKGVNWALRQIGKRILNMNKKAIKISAEIGKSIQRVPDGYFVNLKD
jgi:3-methyladenine DNA glycosylase AlkD